jgi:hypothetical protein
MKKGNAKKQTIHIQGPGTKTACGKPIASSTLWAKKSSPTEAYPGMCKKCYALFAKAKANILGQEAVKKTPEAEGKKKAGKRTPALAAFPNRPAELVVTYKGATHKAAVNPDGTITVNGKIFNSPSRAGKEVTGREVDGWTFWSYEVEGEGLKKLNALREQKA